MGSIQCLQVRHTRCVCVARGACAHVSCRTTVSHQLVANPFYNGIDSPAPDPLKKVLFALSHCNALLSADPAPPARSQGVLLHFVEANASSQPTTAVPWLAMISCDTNATYPSQVDDIFTLAQTHGAQAALLYSTTSEVRSSRPTHNESDPIHS